MLQWSVGLALVATAAQFLPSRTAGRCFRLSPTTLLLLLFCFVGSVGAVGSQTSNTKTVQPSIDKFFSAGANPAAPFRSNKRTTGNVEERAALTNVEEGKLTVMFWNCDGTGLEGALEVANKKKASIVMLTDTRTTDKDKRWDSAVKKVWGNNCCVHSCAGIQQLSGQRIGGCAIAVRDGWVNRCKGFTGDKRGWGRYSVLKLSGSSNMWIVVCYFAYNGSNGGSDSYMELQRSAMRGCAGDKNCTEHMPVTDGKYDPHKLLQRDLEELKTDAFAHKADLIIGGDFNEKYFQRRMKGKLHAWMENEMQLENIHHNGKEGGW